MRDEDHQVDQEPQPNKQIAGDRLLTRLGIDPNKWTVGDRRLALLAVGIGLAIVIIAVCGYIFGWEWTGLAKRTFWDWLSLLIVPIVLAMGGYFFTRSENRRTREDADEQRSLDRKLADERRQDEMLQAYLDGMSQLLTDKERPLHRAELGDYLSTVARARTVTALKRLDADHRNSVLDFLRDSQLIGGVKTSPIVSFHKADFRGADLSGTNLNWANFRTANLLQANLREAELHWVNLQRADLRKADLTMADLSGYMYSRESPFGYVKGGAAYCTGADLSEACLKQAHLRNTYLMGAKLNNANLEEADLSEAHLEGADLSHARLAGANLRNAVLGEHREILWAWTNVSEADLRGADLRGASERTRDKSERLITNEELARQAASLEGATMPNGQKYEEWLKSKGNG